MKKILKVISGIFILLLTLFTPLLILFIHMDSSFPNRFFFNTLNESFQDNINKYYRDIECIYKNIECSLTYKQKNADSSGEPQHLLNFQIYRDNPSFNAVLYLLPNENISWKASYIEKSNLLKWNPRLYFYSETLKASKSEIIHWKQIFIEFCLLQIVLISLWCLCCFFFRNIKVLTIVFILIFLFISYITSSFVESRWIYQLNILKIKESDALKIEKFAADLIKEDKGVTANGASTGLIANIPPELKGIGLSVGFIGKHPVFSTEHVRFNINPLIYIIYTAGNPKDVNEKMDYTKISDKLWIGEYTDFINDVKELNYFSSIVISEIWVVFIIIGYFCFKILGVFDWLRKYVHC